MSDDRVGKVALALCHSGKFACDGRCAPICFEFMGHKPKRCSHAIRVHGDLARDILNTLDPSIESLQAEVERLRFERDDARNALFQMRDMLIAVHDGLEDEGDRVYLGSSNHAELIHEAWHYADAIKWDAFLEGDPAAKEQTR